MKKHISILLSFFVLSVSYAQTLDELLQNANDQNLELKILKTEYLAALEKAPQVSQRPDPVANVGVFPLPVETRLGAQLVRVGATQMLPWKGVLDSKKDLELAKAKAMYERIAVRQLQVHFQIKQAYFQWCQLEQSQAILQRNRLILNSLEEIALAKIESGKATAADVLSVQLKSVELEQELQILETQKAKPLATINQLLNRPLDTPIAAVDSLAFAIIPFQKDTLLAHIEAQHPMLQLYSLQQKVAKQAIVLNELNNKPTVGVGVDYILVNARNDAEPAGNGRDILQLRGSVTIPLYQQKYEAKEREERLKMNALEQQKEATADQFLAIIEQAYVDYETAALQVDLYEQQIEITEAAIRILESNYSSTGKQFDELLRLEKERIEYDLKLLKAIIASHIAKAKVEQFIVP